MALPKEQPFRLPPPPPPPGIDLDNYSYSLISTNINNKNIILASVNIKKTPEGRGLWTVVAREGYAIRLDDLTMHPRFEGLPPEHPPIRNIIGLPMLLRGKLIGGVLVANKSGTGSYLQED